MTQEFTLDTDSHGDSFPMELTFMVSAEWQTPDRSVGERVEWLDGVARLDHGTVLGVRIPYEAFVAHMGMKWIGDMQAFAFEAYRTKESALRFNDGVRA